MGGQARRRHKYVWMDWEGQTAWAWVRTRLQAVPMPCTLLAGSPSSKQTSGCCCSLYSSETAFAGSSVRAAAYPWWKSNAARRNRWAWPLGDGLSTASLRQAAGRWMVLLGRLLSADAGAGPAGLWCCVHGLHGTQDAKSGTGHALSFRDAVTATRVQTRPEPNGLAQGDPWRRGSRDSSCSAHVMAACDAVD